MVDSQYKNFPADWEKYSVIAMMSIYGVDLLPDNVEECRERGIFEMDGVDHTLYNIAIKIQS